MNRGLRDRISDALDELSDETIKVLIEDSLSAEKTVWTEVTCKGCQKTYKYPIEIPDIQARAKVLDILATQGKGKPTETVKHEVEVSVRRVEELTVLELEVEEARLRRELEPAS